MNEENVKELRGEIERITYCNPENGYHVLKVKSDDMYGRITVTGNFLDINVGQNILFRGQWVEDSKYGRQFKASSWEEQLPVTIKGIEAYLGSGIIDGVGRTYAKRIVRMFGLKTFDVIEHEPERLMSVPGIKEKRMTMIKESWKEQMGMRHLMLFLQPYDITTNIIIKIYKKYRDNSVEKLKENPYCIADDIWGIGFKTADEIGRKMGIEKNAFIRLKSGILYTMNELTKNGNVYLEHQQLVSKAVELLDAEEDKVISSLTKIYHDGDLVKTKIETEEFDKEKQEMILVSKNAIYLPNLYRAEICVAKMLIKIKNSSGLNIHVTEREIDQIQNSLGITYDTIQRKAIFSAGMEQVMILTGGPGTGKTTTLQGIINEYKMHGLEILLAAPTGRAAKRMTEATGMEAKTIHRLLECTGPGKFMRNEYDPLEGDVLVIDECSMIDIQLMYHLLNAIPSGMKLLLVGDIDQLPSVGPGNVLRDIIDSEKFTTIRLQKIFRQAQESMIVTNAHRINKGEMPLLKTEGKTDFFFANIENPERAAKYIVSLVKEKLPEAYHIQSGDIQVLSPMRKGELGTIYLNKELQQAVNPKGVEISCRGTVLRINDKVMQIVNNYEKDVFNGDIGTIVSIDQEENTFGVNFDGKLVIYKRNETEELTHAYATTIHKSQGSEYPIVIMPVTMSHFIMLQRNLIYTGLTRAKKVIVIVGTKKALGYAVRNVETYKRNSYLRERLQKMS